MGTLGVQRSCICITHPSLPVRLAWGPVMQTAIVQVSRGVGHLACSRDNCLGTLRCMLATLQLCAHLCEVLVITPHSYIARLFVNQCVHLYYPSEDALLLGMGTCDAETALDQFSPGIGRLSFIRDNRLGTVWRPSRSRL